jgi:hypothetical protein
MALSGGFFLIQPAIGVQSILQANGPTGSLSCRLNGVMSFLPAKRFHSPYYRSAGHRLCSFGMASSCGRGWS